MKTAQIALVLSCLALTACQTRSQKTSDFDVIVRGGDVYDGSGGPLRHTDIAVRGQRIAALGDLSNAHAPREIEKDGAAQTVR